VRDILKEDKADEVRVAVWHKLSHNSDMALRGFATKLHDDVRKLEPAHLHKLLPYLSQRVITLTRGTG